MSALTSAATLLPALLVGLSYIAFFNPVMKRLVLAETGRPILRPFALLTILTMAITLVYDGLSSSNTVVITNAIHAFFIGFVLAVGVITAWGIQIRVRGFELAVERPDV